MFELAMDCLFGGIGITLLIGGVDALIKNDMRDFKDFCWLSGAFGTALFLLTKFIFGFMIFWSMWD